MQSLFPLLESAVDCDCLAAQFDPSRPVICLYATVAQAQTISVALRLRQGLTERGFQTLLLLSVEAANTFDATRLSPPLSQGIVAECRTVCILDNLPCVRLLIASDYTLGRVLHPRCKTLAIQHNIEHSGLLSINSWADYVLSHTTDNSQHFDYSIYPNAIKYHVGKTITVIPAGYPKLDVLCEQAQAAPVRKRFSYFPTGEATLVCDKTDVSSVEREEIVLLDGLLNTYPQHELVIRPFPQGNHTLRIQNLRKRYASNSRVLFDDGEDNVRYLVDAELLFTDASSVYINFPYATLRPSVRLIAGVSTIPSPFALSLVGYDSATGEGALLAVHDALANLDTWRNKLERVRQEKMINPGMACDYICDHMQHILDDTPPADWLVIDKGDTPFSKPADFLKAFARPDFLSHYFTTPLRDAIQLHGSNPKIALAALRAMLKNWHPSYSVEFEHACILVPAGQIIGLFQHMAQLTHVNETALARLAWALDRWNPDSEDLPALVSRLQDFPFTDIHNALLAARSVRQHSGSAHAALNVVRKVFPPHTPQEGFPVPDMRHWPGAWQQNAAMLTALLLEAGQLDAAAVALKKWKLAFQNNSLLLPTHSLLRAVLCRARRALGQPIFFSYGHYVIQCPGVNVFFRNNTQLTETLSLALKYGLSAQQVVAWCQQAGLPPRMWPHEGMTVDRIAQLEAIVMLLQTELELRTGLPDTALPVLERRKKQGNLCPHSLQEMTELWRDKRLAIWGTSGRYRDVVGPIVHNAGFGAEVVVFIDSDPQKAGTVLNGIPVAAPEEACKYSFEGLVIASFAVMPILRRIVELGFECPVFSAD